ncbi:hypothetical protein PRZ48_000264 [Zasmidium cellare]|uniref:Mitochondrial thiamine pyrophosphate carrier 1 n=1 Tax=Zasmidium cellare TaxID=395010 RepID=A0ABR0EY15_ZASCE|nr:hypothetical protein PRZ48_000264 [Zasmidium cellare]
MAQATVTTAELTPTSKTVQETLKPRATKKTQNSPLVSLIAGATAGAVEASITYPFEFIKTRSQLRSNGQVTSKSPLSVLRTTVAQDGVLGIYTGCGSLVAGTALKASVRFFTYDSIKQLLSDDRGKLSPARGILAGMAAGAVESAVAVTPTERIKTALIDDAKGAKRFKGTGHAIGLLIREQGIKGIYRGLLSTTIKQSATSAVRMGSYNVLRTEYQERLGTPQAVGTFAIGAIAGTITVYATQPFDTLKTRAQGAQSEGMLVAARSILVEDGIKGFWRGSSMRLGRLVMSGGIVFTIYEQVAAQLRGLQW